MAWIFVDRPSEKLAVCRLRCLSKDNNDRFQFTAIGTTHVERHVQSKHPSFYDKFEKAKDNYYNVAMLESEIDAANSKAIQRILALKATADKFFRRVKVAGLDNKVKCDLELLMWAIANGVSRLALNSPILDQYLHGIGSTAAPNRHDLGTEYLQQLDSLVKKEIRCSLAEASSVCLSSDGWSDITRRFWVDLGIAFIAEVETKKEWQLLVVDADLIPIPGSATGDVLETVISESVEEFVPPQCLIATSTNDGGGDERKAAFQFVKDGNDWYCVAHRVQLAIADCLDAKRRDPPPDCKPFRDLINKAHDLVVFVNGHRAPLRAFQSLSAFKRQVLLSL